MLLVPVLQGILYPAPPLSFECLVRQGDVCTAKNGEIEHLVTRDQFLKKGIGLQGFWETWVLGIVSIDSDLH